MAFLTRVTNKLADEEGSQSAAQPEAEAESKERSPKLGFLARGSVAALRPFARLVKGASGKWEEGAELKVGSLAARTTSGAGEEASLVRPSGGGLAGLSRLLFKPATSSSADEQARQPRRQRRVLSAAAGGTRLPLRRHASAATPTFIVLPWCRLRKR